MAKEWVNWSGSVRTHPAVAERPRDEGELVAAIRRAAESGRRVGATRAGDGGAALVGRVAALR